MLRPVAIAIAAMLQNTAAHAQQGKDMAYYCTSEVATGLFYNKDLKRWVSTNFKPSDPFVLRLKFEETKMEKEYSFSTEELATYYTLTMTPKGTDNAAECRKYGSGTTAKMRVFDYLYFACNSNLTDYQINLKTGRFLAAYSVGYINGSDNNNDNPAMTAGTCTKIQ